ncbi:ergothioneine biosynthesis protein EgtB [Ascidiimonas aurantiaca]|uniref:ergothioneine biosynthesis protein EgtB n=1 Tax=Ascidiimonas aurantiaca TaxID=1685432 RepID=UPI0030EB6DE9
MILTNNLLTFFTDTRKHTEDICAPLETEDYVVQPVVDVSPPKWHLGHTTWFFEEFILKKHLPEYQVFNDDFAFIFNSYYETVGKRVVRAHRGNLSRPGVSKVYAYRRHVTRAMEKLLERELPSDIIDVIEIGIHHEKQHQELLLTDIKYILGNNPLLPVYHIDFKENHHTSGLGDWIRVPESTYEIGHYGNQFCYDNELGRHKVYLHEFEISKNLVSNADFLAFIQDNGYKRFEFWHAEAWDWVKNKNITSPLYWHLVDNQWHQFTLSGLQELDLQAPVTHLSYYESYAFAQWRSLRLPTEFEWEAAQHLFDWGQRWEWTESAYLPYPGYQKAPGALGEYNGKFMVNQKVLRGGSIATPSNHTRPTYRNFFHPYLQWQFTGLRLAR